jgi:hypothetical protein
MGCSHVLTHKSPSGTSASHSSSSDTRRFVSGWQQQQDLQTGAWQTLKDQDNAAINQGDLFILNGESSRIAPPPCMRLERCRKRVFSHPVPML